MQTDISLRCADRTVIIETKFYAEAFASRFENDKLRPAHLYQLIAYLQNLAAANAGSDTSAAGMLLYPEVHPLPTLKYRRGPHRVTATGIDLTKA
jgi:5-methylcytosine-specific restriction enzyme subunit McrC